MLEEDRIAKEVVDAAIKLHKQFGPGVYESVYEPLMVYELEKRGFVVRNQIPAPLMYDGIKFEAGFTMDVVVCELVILELKSVENRAGSFQAASDVSQVDGTPPRAPD